jgi:NADH dehydrogenase [ubiquinone] 1 alpha subcomplex assembly factor 7
MSSARADDGGAALLASLRERIRRDGPMPLDEYMRLCQADPEHGYWQRAGSIGAAGDFITAPEISQVFGELIGLWCAVVWQGMSRPAPLRLIELGPGRGTLMRDALRAARRVPGFLDATTVHLVEASAPLREMQRQAFLPPLGGSPPPPHAEGVSSTRRGEGLGVGGAMTANVLHPPPPSPTRGEGVPLAIAWHDSLEQVPDDAAIVIANEFLDALPIRQLEYLDGGWRERVVDIDAQGVLRLAAGSRVDLGVEGLDAPPEQGVILELRAGEDQLLAQLARRQAPFTALFIDYGPAGSAHGDTLQAVHRHAWVDPLSLPGIADLTAHVQFASLAHKARAMGLVADGPITQAEFLGRLGIAERAARLMAANSERAGEIETGVQRLMSPTGMGELFKAMALRSRTLPSPPPFV